MRMDVLSTYVSTYMCAWCPQRSKEGIGSPRTCIPACGCWEAKPCPLGKQPVILTDEASLTKDGIESLHHVVSVGVRGHAHKAPRELGKWLSVVKVPVAK